MARPLFDHYPETKSDDTWAGRRHAAAAGNATSGKLLAAARNRTFIWILLGLTALRHTRMRPLALYTVFPCLSFVLCPDTPDSWMVPHLSKLRYLFWNTIRILSLNLSLPFLQIYALE